MIVNFAVFDARNFVTTLPIRMLLTLPFIILIGVIIPIQGAAIVCGAVVGAVSLSYFFQADEQGRLDELYALSIGSRTAVVIGRYLASVVVGLAFAMAGAVVTLASVVLRQQEPNWPVIATLFLLGCGVVTAATALQTPWFFAVGYTKGRPAFFVLIAAIALLGWLEGKVHLLDGLTTTLTTISPALSVAAAVLAGIALLAVSATVASHLYNRRQL